MLGAGLHVTILPRSTWCGLRLASAAAQVGFIIAPTAVILLFPPLVLTLPRAGWNGASPGVARVGPTPSGGRWATHSSRWLTCSLVRLYGLLALVLAPLDRAASDRPGLSSWCLSRLEPDGRDTATAGDSPLLLHDTTSPPSDSSPRRRSSPSAHARSISAFVEKRVTFLVHVGGPRRVCGARRPSPRAAVVGGATVATDAPANASAPSVRPACGGPPLLLLTLGRADDVRCA